MRILPGRAAPLGASVEDGGVNFSVYAKEATRVELLLFEHADSPGPSRVLELSAPTHTSFHYWHAFVPGLVAGQVYGYRVDGPYRPESGAEFNAAKVLLDPYGRLVVTPKSYDRSAASGSLDNVASALRSVVIDTKSYDWEGDVSPARAFEDTVIYELHVKGFTYHPSSGVTEGRRGTYRGLIEKIPYLVSLGVTAVELLPVFAFDPGDAPSGRTNYWGYSPLSFFAVHAPYACMEQGTGPLDEFRDMVKAFHRAGIEVILDAVYNHTSEGDRTGPTNSLRGFHAGTYYLLEGDRLAHHAGTGNTLNAAHAVTQRLIVDSLRYWVKEMHIDGFRFDLSSMLTRDVWGRPQESSQIIQSIETDPVLARTKFIAEPWDVTGLNQLSTFVGDRWREWNGRFRDDVRRFIKGDPHVVRAIPHRLFASPELSLKDNREPEQSIHFVSCHDGLTLNDVVSYDAKHNEDNGERNCDGETNNHSWNHGVEGPSDDPDIEALRERQIKNLLVLTLISAGVPLIGMGDEARRTQRGNNNAYCQDREMSWFDWSLVEKNSTLVRFVREMVRFRTRFSPTRDDEGKLVDLLARHSIQWHGTKLFQPDWSDHSRTVSFTVGGGLLHLIFNSHWEALRFELPVCRTGRWRLFVDTSLRSPSDIHPFSKAKVLDEAQSYLVQSRSCVLLIV